jgi:acetamidase/formamidase
VISAALAPVLLWEPLAAQHLHRLPATPQTVAWGYYSAAAMPVLRIASGDTIEVETLITNRPDRLEAAGVAPADVQQSLRDIVAQDSDRGPGGHILTGPVYVEGADSGDVLEVRILSIDLAIRTATTVAPDFCRPTATPHNAPASSRSIASA